VITGTVLDKSLVGEKFGRFGKTCQIAKLYLPNFVLKNGMTAYVHVP